MSALSWDELNLRLGGVELDHVPYPTQFTQGGALWGCLFPFSRQTLHFGPSATIRYAVGYLNHKREIAHQRRLSQTEGLHYLGNNFHG